MHNYYVNAVAQSQRRGNRGLLLIGHWEHKALCAAAKLDDAAASRWRGDARARARTAASPCAPHSPWPAQQCSLRSRGRASAPPPLGRALAQSETSIETRRLRSSLQACRRRAPRGRLASWPLGQCGPDHKTSRPARRLKSAPPRAICRCAGIHEAIVLQDGSARVGPGFSPDNHEHPH